MVLFLLHPYPFLPEQSVGRRLSLHISTQPLNPYTMASISRSMSRLAAGARITVILRTGLQVPRATCVNRASVLHNINSKRLGSTAAALKKKTQDAGSLAPTQSRSRSKVYKDADEAVADIKSGSTVLSAGFGLCGVAGEWRTSTTSQLHLQC